MKPFHLLSACIALSLGSLSADVALPATDTSVFADEFLTKLKPATTADQIDAISQPSLKQAAKQLLAGTFRADERKRVCAAYEPVDRLAKRLKTSGYSQFENPTGIFFETGEDAIVVVQGLGTHAASLRIHDFGPKQSDQSYPLKDGVNVISQKGRGLAYVSYYVDDYQTAPKLAVSVVSGRVNGVYDAAKSSNADWKKMLDGACTDMFDLVGERVQLIFSVKELRDYCADPKRLMSLYDQIIGDQHQIMGLEKYGLVPANHMLGRAMWQGYMHADGFGAAFHHDTLKELADPDKVPMHAWAIAHEFGHVNQTRPGMKWVSTSEVTNNIFSCCSNYQLNRGDMRLEHEEIDGGDGNVIGGRFNAFLNSALVAKENWLCQRGPDKMKGYENGGDHFVKLVPLWQLQLFFGAAGHGNPDLYADIFQKVRNTDESKLTNGQLQLNFMRNVCDVEKLNLTDFFVLTGMLKPIDKDMDDYSRAQLTITAADCAELVKYAERYPKPDSPVIFYISTNSVDAYRKRLPVEGKFDQGVAVTGAARTIDHAVWKHAVAFETYSGKELIKIAMVGTGTKDNRSTLVLYPTGATRIEAVAWDGTRTLVTGSR